MKNIKQKIKSASTTIFKLSIVNLVLLILSIVFNYLLTANLLITIINSVLILLINNIYMTKKKTRLNDNELDFQINCLIKNVSVKSLTNNFNVVQSLQHCSEFLYGDFKNDIDQCVEAININYDYAQAFEQLKQKYKSKKIFCKFISDLLIIKKQSNIDNTAKSIFDITNKEMKNYIGRKNQIQKISDSQLTSFFVTLILGYLVTLLIAFSLFQYYYAWVQTGSGLLITEVVFIINLIICRLFIHRVFDYKEEDA